MDELDAEIIRLLQSDARLSNRELARRLGIAPSTCLERVRALTRRGVIRGYHAEIDMKALNRGVQALIAVQVRPLRRSVIEDFKDSVGKLPEVMTVFVIAGGDDFLLHVAVQDLDHLHAFLLDRLSKRGEIIGFRTSVIYQRVHNTVLTRLPAGEHPTAEGTHLTADCMRAAPGSHEPAAERQDFAPVLALLVAEPYDKRAHAEIHAQKLGMQPRIVPQDSGPVLPQRLFPGHHAAARHHPIRG